MWVFPKIGYPQIIHFNRVFHYKPSILGVSLFLDTPMYFFDLLFFIFLPCLSALSQAADDPFLPYWNLQLSSMHHGLFPLVFPSLHASTKQICQAQIFRSYSNQGPAAAPSTMSIHVGSSSPGMFRPTRIPLQAPSPSMPFPAAFVRIPNRTWTAIYEVYGGHRFFRAIP